MNEAIKMQLSAFVDGELPENEQELLLRRLSQSADLRQQVAEYFAIGHAVRGEIQLGGMNVLRDRVAAAIGDKPSSEADADVDKREDRLVRPLTGVAIAATVAVAAIFGLRQLTDADDADAAGTQAVVTTADFPTQPDADDLLRQYRLLHNAQASDLGANSIITRLTTFEMLEDDTAEADGELPGASIDSADDRGTDRSEQ